MRRRIIVAMVGVTAIALALFAAPLVQALSHLHREEEVVRLERAAAEASGDVPQSFPHGAKFDFPAHLGHHAVGLYGIDGRRAAGVGPQTGDSMVQAALRGDVRDRRIGNRLVVSIPLLRGEKVVGAVRASVPFTVVTDRTRWAIVRMALIAVLALLGSGVVAFWQSRRLARPVARLAHGAARLGHGDFTVRTERSGVPEVDSVASALDATAVRLDDMITRERTFSEDASHQLRTPLTSLRVTLESTRLSPHADPTAAIDTALEEADRIEATIEDLLALAREAPSADTDTDLRGVLVAADDDWQGRATSAGRPLLITAEGNLPRVSVSDRAVRQVLDVLIDNAIRHGDGSITVKARPAASGAAIEVGDEGAGIDGDADRIFQRRVSGDGGSGIGLALARSLAEAEGGRLRLARAAPKPIFELVLPGVAR